VAKRKPGLHKNVSSIFEGVRIPKEAPLRTLSDLSAKSLTYRVILAYMTKKKQDCPAKKKSRLFLWSLLKFFGIRRPKNNILRAYPNKPEQRNVIMAQTK